MNKPTTLYVSDNDLIKWTGEDGKLHCIQIRQDDSGEDSPRDWDNLTIMACFHRRYRLGDNLGDSLGEDCGEKYSPDAYLLRLVRKTLSDEALAAAFKAGKCPRVTIFPSDQDPSRYDICLKEDGELLVGEVEEKELGHELDYILDDIVETRDCLALLSDYMEYLPLWLYDHSGITMSCGTRTYPYNDEWDSGQVGWIFAMKSTLIKEGVATEENWREVAKKTMEYDVKVYDYFLTNQVYGYTLYEAARPENPDEKPNWEETDSCWAFYGDDIMENGIADTVDIRDVIKDGAYTTGTAKEVHTISYEFEFAS